MSQVNHGSTTAAQPEVAGVESKQTRNGSEDLIDFGSGEDDEPKHEKPGDAQVEHLAEGLENTTITNGRETQSAEGQGKALPASPPPPDPPAESEKPYLDPTPKTPTLSRRPSAQDANLEYDEKDGGLPEPLTPVQQEKAPVDDNDSAVEIQSIMDQFADDTRAPTKEEIMSPRHEPEDPMQAAAGGFPPRRSSLEPLRSRNMDDIATSPTSGQAEKFDSFPASPPPVPPKPDLASLKSPPASLKDVSTSHLPMPEPEPELPFDFHRFLEQLRHKSADPVARFLRSFLTEFGKKQWLVHEQVKLIGDFLAFITNKMALCDVWREVSDNEFDNAKEGMEKLVMNRLYGQTFSPAIPSPPSVRRSTSRGKRKELEKVLGTGRRGQHQEDVERDDILAQKIRIYSWVREEHLDIPPVGANGERFLRLAQQELVKIKSYRAPRDKIICILNCCKVIFGLLKNAQSSDTSADSFVPLLIYVVLQANPEHLVSNIQYILRFRNSDKLSGEAGYYLSSLSGAIQFIEGLDRTTLTVSDEDFEKHVEAAVSAIAAQNRETDVSSPVQQISEKSALAEPEVTPRNSLEVTSITPRRTHSRSGPSSRGGDGTSDDAVGGLLRTIQRPLSSIGRFLSDTDTRQDQGTGSPAPVRKLSPSVFQPPSAESESASQGPHVEKPQVQQYDAQEAAARQASAEAAEARRIQRAEHRTVVDTLCGMFPNLDREVIDDVVRQKQGRVGLAVDACLALTAGG
ncbi:hypothetical protein LTR70_005621 [Exophiala xenobiotica]|uniref:Guanine nucleotide exchange factor Vps9 n=1 Tax=Lithohypha guttulata TaxID=1690604 RepID=A0ABR0K954_9EURO|nr:hypothetical protein LTR24_005311 [Lithohypha guttulata]KAK5318038.1 hypothetical protein LTR70_005621 [Exophiala xenobiotica]